MKHFCSFSEAIRAADGVLQQSFFGPGAREILKIDKGKVCAIEGGLQMMGLKRDDPETDFIYREAKRRFPYTETIAACPQPDCDEDRDALINLIWHLNDDHHLSFSQIADWLESEEEKLGYVTVVESPEPVSETVASLS